MLHISGASFSPQLLTISNMHASALKARGNAQFAAGDYAAAQASYSEAIRALDAQEDPHGLHLIYGNRRVALSLLQDAAPCHRPGRVAEAATASCSLTSPPLTCKCRAAAALKQSQWAAALQDAETALAAEPRWAKALYRKAAALQGLGQLAAAAAAAQQALQIEPSNREVQALLKQLQRSQGANGGTAGQQQRPVQAAARAGVAGPAPIAELLPPLLARAPWEHVAAPDGADENLLLLLHGLGDRPGAFASLARRMALPQVGSQRARPHAGLPPMPAPQLLPPPLPLRRLALRGGALVSCCWCAMPRTRRPPYAPTARRACCRRPPWRWAARRRCPSATAGAAGTPPSPPT